MSSGLRYSMPSSHEISTRSRAQLCHFANVCLKRDLLYPVKHKVCSTEIHIKPAWFAVRLPTFSLCLSFHVSLFDALRNCTVFLLYGIPSARRCVKFQGLDFRPETPTGEPYSTRHHLRALPCGALASTLPNISDMTSLEMRG